MPSGQPCAFGHLTWWSQHERRRQPKDDPALQERALPTWVCSVYCAHESSIPAGRRDSICSGSSFLPLLSPRRSRYVEMLAVLFFMMVTSEEETTLSFPA